MAALRALIPWRLLRWINNHSETCWASLAAWKLGHCSLLHVIHEYGRCKDAADSEVGCWCRKYRPVQEQGVPRNGVNGT